MKPGHTFRLTVAGSHDRGSVNRSACQEQGASEEANRAGPGHVSWHSYLLRVTDPRSADNPFRP